MANAVWAGRSAEARLGWRDVGVVKDDVRENRAGGAKHGGRKVVAKRSVAARGKPPARSAPARPTTDRVVTDRRTRTDGRRLRGVGGAGVLASP